MNRFIILGTGRLPKRNLKPKTFLAVTIQPILVITVSTFKNEPFNLCLTEMTVCDWDEYVGL